MNQEIQDLVLAVTPKRGIESMRVGDIYGWTKKTRLYRWRKAMNIWNKTHLRNRSSLTSIVVAFRSVWQNVLVWYDVDNGNVVYIATARMTLKFWSAEDGTLFGGIYIDSDNCAKTEIHMNPFELAEFACRLSNVVLSKGDVERTVREIDEAKSELEFENAMFETEQFAEQNQYYKDIERLFFLYYLIGDLYAELGYHSEALEHYRGALTLLPAFREAKEYCQIENEYWLYLSSTKHLFYYNNAEELLLDSVSCSLYNL